MNIGDGLIISIEELEIITKLKDNKSLVYVASSWRNPFYENVVNALEAENYAVWNWRNPPTGDPGFSWQHADPNYNGGVVNMEVYKRLLATPQANRGFRNDKLGMRFADFGVLLLPSGRSAHNEAGYMCGKGKPVHVLRMIPEEPDLMYKLFASISETIPELIASMKGTG